MGILLINPLPLHRLPPILIYPEYETLEYTVNILYAGKVILTAQQLYHAQRFHLDMFSFILKHTQSKFEGLILLYIVCIMCVI